MTDRPRPDGLAAAGAALWDAVTDVLDIDEHEALALRELCRTADVLDELQAVVVRDGVLLDSSQGARAHPALTELRQQRITFARLVAAMRLPAGLADGRPSAIGGAQQGQARSGVRGFYAIDGGSA